MKHKISSYKYIKSPDFSGDFFCGEWFGLIVRYILVFSSLSGEVGFAQSQETLRSGGNGKPQFGGWGLGFEWVLAGYY